MLKNWGSFALESGTLGSLGRRCVPSYFGSYSGYSVTWLDADTSSYH
jgi:hypothetical protein